MRIKLMILSSVLILGFLCCILWMAWMGWIETGEGQPELWVWILLAS